MTKLLSPRDVSRIRGSFIQSAPRKGYYLRGTSLIARRCYFRKQPTSTARARKTRILESSEQKNKPWAWRQTVSEAAKLKFLNTGLRQLPYENAEFKRVLDERSEAKVSDDAQEHETLWRQMQDDIVLNRELYKSGQLKPFANPEHAAASYQLLLNRLDKPFQRYRNAYNETLDTLLDFARDDVSSRFVADRKQTVTQWAWRRSRFLRRERLEIMTLLREVKDVAKITDSIITREAIFFEHVTRLATIKTSFHRVDSGWQTVHQILYASGSNTPQWARIRLPPEQLQKWSLMIKQGKAEFKELLDRRLLRSNVALYHFKRTIDFYHDVSRNAVSAQAAMDRLRKFYWDLATRGLPFEQQTAWMTAWARRAGLELIELSSIYRSLLLYIAAHVREKYQYQQAPGPEAEELPNYVIRGLAVQQHVANLPPLPYPDLRPSGRDVFKLTGPMRDAGKVAVEAEPAALASNVAYDEDVVHHDASEEHGTQNLDSANTVLDHTDPLMDDADIPDIGFTYREMLRTGESTPGSTSPNMTRKSSPGRPSQDYVVGTRTHMYATLLRERNAQRKQSPHTDHNSYGSFRRRSRQRPKNYGRLLQRFQGKTPDVHDAREAPGNRTDSGTRQSFATPSIVPDLRNTSSGPVSDETLIVEDLMAQTASLEAMNHDDLNKLQKTPVNIEAIASTAPDTNAASDTNATPDTNVAPDNNAAQDVQPKTIAQAPLRSLVDVFVHSNPRRHAHRDWASHRLQMTLGSRSAKARAKELVLRRGGTKKNHFRSPKTAPSSSEAQTMNELQGAVRAHGGKDAKTDLLQPSEESDQSRRTLARDASLSTTSSSQSQAERNFLRVFPPTPSSETAMPHKAGEVPTKKSNVRLIKTDRSPYAETIAELSHAMRPTTSQNAGTDLLQPSSQSEASAQTLDRGASRVTTSPDTIQAASFAASISPLVVLDREEWRKKIEERLTWVEYVHSQVRKAVLADSVLEGQHKEEKVMPKVYLSRFEKLHAVRLLKWAAYAKIQKGRYSTDGTVASKPITHGHDQSGHTNEALFEHFRHLRRKASELEDAGLAFVTKYVRRRRHLRTVLGQEGCSSQETPEDEVEPDSSVTSRDELSPTSEIGRNPRGPQALSPVRKIIQDRPEEVLQQDKRVDRLNRLRRVLSLRDRSRPSRSLTEATQIANKTVLAPADAAQPQVVATEPYENPDAGRCPSCGFRNMDNIATCHVCNTVLGGAHQPNTKFTASTFSVGPAPASQHTFAPPATSIVRKTVPKKFAKLDNDINEQRIQNLRLRKRIRMELWERSANKPAPPATPRVRKLVPKEVVKLDNDIDDQHIQNLRLRRRIRMELWERSHAKEYVISKNFAAS